MDGFAAPNRPDDPQWDEIIRVQQLSEVAEKALRRVAPNISTDRVERLTKAALQGLRAADLTRCSDAEGLSAKLTEIASSLAEPDHPESALEEKEPEESARDFLSRVWPKIKRQWVRDGLLAVAAKQLEGHEHEAESIVNTVLAEREWPEHDDGIDVPRIEEIKASLKRTVLIRIERFLNYCARPHRFDLAALQRREPPDQAAWEAAMPVFGKVVYRSVQHYLWGVTGEHDMQDCASGIVARFWEKGVYDCRRPEDVLPFLRSAARFGALEFVKKIQLQQDRFVGWNPDDGDDDFGAVEPDNPVHGLPPPPPPGLARDDLERLILRAPMSDPERRVLIGCLLEELEPGQLANVLHTSIEAIYRMKCEARRKLRRYLGYHGDDWI